MLVLLCGLLQVVINGRWIVCNHEQVILKVIFTKHLFFQFQNKLHLLSCLTFVALILTLFSCTAFPNVFWRPLVLTERHIITWLIVWMTSPFNGNNNCFLLAEHHPRKMLEPGGAPSVFCFKLPLMLEGCAYSICPENGDPFALAYPSSTNFQQKDYKKNSCP